MTKNRTSMADIAAHAGVSTATVSRVFNGVGQVSADTRRKVLTAIDELGYDRPTPERTPDTPTIGIIVPELTNPIFASLPTTSRRRCREQVVFHSFGRKHRVQPRSSTTYLLYSTIV